MGFCKSKHRVEDPGAITIRDFTVEMAIGRGGFGKVFIVEKDGRKLAMKQMLKARVMHKDSVTSVIRELDFLRRIDQS